MSEEYFKKKEGKKAIIALLFQMADADEAVDPKEEKFVYDVAAYIGLTPSDVQSVKDNPTDHRFVAPPEEQERMNILYYLLFAMAVDGRIEEEEERLCYKAGLRLGFNDRMTADLIAVMKQYLNKEMPGDALIKEIKKYLN